jgi:cytochrome c biogenesis factor
MTDGLFVGTVLFPVVVALAVLAAFFYSLYRVVMHDEEFENNWKFYGHYVVVFVSLVALVVAISVVVQAERIKAKGASTAIIFFTELSIYNS